MDESPTESMEWWVSLRPEETHEGRLGRIERARNGRNGEEGRTVKEGGYNAPIILLPKLKCATVLPPSLNVQDSISSFVFSSVQKRKFSFCFMQKKVFGLFHFNFLLTFQWKAIKTKTNQVIFTITYLNNKEVEILTFRETTLSRLNKFIGSIIF